MIIDGDLAEAMEKAILTRLERSDIEPGHFTGYVVDATDELLLFLVVSDLILFNGFSILRVCDLTSIEVPAPNFKFVEKALRIRDEEIEKAPPIDLSSITAVLESSSKVYPLVTIHWEKIDPDVCFIGHVVNVGDARLSMFDIAPGAEWDNEPTERAVLDITRIDFGGKYEDALFQVGGDPPNMANAADTKSSAAD
ncbi:MAG: hypothetical protein GY820_38060 [Gammaproteobacteria bacterium]|nr:hypothetical protein [Gammaproteobacteria bacterium]